MIFCPYAAASDLTDSILGIEPTDRYTSGRGYLLRDRFGPEANQRPAQSSQESFLPDSEFDGLVSPLINTDSSDKDIDYPGPLYDTDVPLLDDIPGSDYELLDLEPLSDYEL